MPDNLAGTPQLLGAAGPGNMSRQERSRDGNQDRSVTNGMCDSMFLSLDIFNGFTKIQIKQYVIADAKYNRQYV